jgi:adenylate cyclase
LIDAANGAHIWADRFDGGLEDVFGLQDKVTESVAGAIEPKLRYAEIQRSHQKPTGSLQAYDYFLRALAKFNMMTWEPNFEAVALLERAFAIDPEYWSAYALGALCVAFRKGQGWMADRDVESAEGLHMARIALAGAPNDATVLYMGSLAMAYLDGGNEEAALLMDRALFINPNLAAAWHLSGWIRIYLGRGEAAVDHFQRAIRLSPLDPLMHIMLCGVAGAHLTAGNNEEVVAWADKALRAGPVFLPALRVKVTALGLLGRLEEARALAPQLMALEPDLRLSELHKRVPWGPGLLARYAAGLRAAGVPE